MKLGQFIIICLSLTAFFTPQKSEGQTISGVINSYYKATAIIDNGTYNSYSYSGITLQSIAGLSTGDRVMIIQMKGAAITSTNNSSFGNISSIGNAGRYEFSSICGFLNNTIVLSNHLLNTYDASEIQVVRVPVYENVTVIGTLSATPWDATSGLGGVIAFEVTNTLILNAGISANGIGFQGGELVNFPSTTSCGGETGYEYSLSESNNPNQGGAPKGEGIADYITNSEYGRAHLANGGGGGNEQNTGGGGGGNYGAGNRGGNQTSTGFCTATTAGLGGLSLSGHGYTLANNRIFLGGGGGTGEMNNNFGMPGGDGGGIIYIKANEIIGNGYTITANGTQGQNPARPAPYIYGEDDGGGGGGAGGVILLNVSAYTGNLSISANGADGSTVGFQNRCPGPGGGGGGGVIWYTGNLAGAITTSALGGAAGVINNFNAGYNPSCKGTTNSAGDGDDGAVQNGFVAPQGTNTIDCSILPFDLLKQFSGRRNNRSIYLNWTFTNFDNVQKVVLERKAGNEQFRKITEQSNPTTNNGFYTDEESISNITYRLIVYSWNGERQYSNHVFFEADERKTFHLYPNPATNEVTIQLPPNLNGRAGIVVTDVNGRQVRMQHIMIPASQTNIKLGLKDLPAGIYHLRLEINGEVYSAKLIKQ